MKRVLREPLVHFLLGGVALFLLYGLVATGPDDPTSRRVVVSEDRIALLTASFERTWMRSPTAAELRGLIDEFVTEEVLYREALALGLDRDDLVVRRRLRQKMDFLSDGIADRDPTDEELGAFLAANPERFRIPPRTSFEQIFLDPRANGVVGERAATLLARLRDDPDAEVAGDPTLLPHGLDAATPLEIANAFGAPFASELAEAPVGTWTGPLTSAFGAHLVRVVAREPERLPPLAEVRDGVEREWAADRRAAGQKRFYETLRARYQVEIHAPPPARDADLAARP